MAATAATHRQKEQDEQPPGDWEAASGIKNAITILKNGPRPDGNEYPASGLGTNRIASTWFFDHRADIPSISVYRACFSFIRFLINFYWWDRVTLLGLLQAIYGGFDNTLIFDGL